MTRAKSTAGLPDSDVRRWLDGFWLAAGVFAALSLIALVAVVVTANSKGFEAWYLLILATAATGGGALVGFLYATFGKEEERFGDAFKVINGVIGGFALADLTAADSTIVRVLRKLAEPAGPGVKPGVAVAVMATFGAIGFLFLYLNKKLVLNLLTARAEREVSALAANAVTVAEGIGVEALRMPGEAPEVPEDGAVARAAEAVRAAVESGQEGSPLELKAAAKAFYIAEEWDRAEQALRRAYRASPRDPETLLFLAGVLISDDRPKEAIPYLEELKKLKSAPAMTWKLLGYAYLWRTDKLAEAAEASERYLAAFPDDEGARLNRACAWAQPGPRADDEEFNQKVIGEVRELARDAALRQRIVELTEEGEDFSLWRERADFRQVLNLS